MDVVSLFSGAGGLDLGFHQQNFNIVWANDFDKFAIQTYNENFSNPATFGDLNEIELDSIPLADVVIGGFPCQPFSMMGHEKGFEDARGTLFFRIVEVINSMSKRGKKPRVLVLENVRTLKTHDKGNTYKVIKNILENELGYKVFTQILNTVNYGIPQTRNRTFIVCFANHDAQYEFPKEVELKLTMQDLLEENVDQKYFLSDKIIPTILSEGTGGYRAKAEIDLPVARPLTATMHKMHRASQDNYVTDNGRIRRLTPREAARLQGFPEEFIIPVSDTQAYRQFGNAVTVAVSNKVAERVKTTLQELGEWN
ncbi:MULTISPECIES: DNA cytosine methyltransferase [unclassified Streptococcus]|uniref:DNA cytosine methyltransferase n=1 Tax=unclassified Streptococcus TaxID=2608887 RepID=UPI001071FE70|nr:MULTISPECIES: DNA (cytosine-5-)-methyltransferase [unclassified Streptococcus]MBF0806703.1 DNA (cytosine-5-)-methyltransferase [Streptococcus sp. 19428wA2_WM07]TFU26479.1 DNA (cytosine-5-)-methyltransferase [Streptococcus sp. WM07]